MKKFIFTVLLIILQLTGYADNGKETVPKNRIMSLVSEYGGNKGFDIIKIGPLGTSLLKTAMKIAASKEDEEEMQETMKLLKGVKRIAVIDYENADATSKNAFNSNLDKILDSTNLLMEAKDGRDLVKIYGIVDEAGTQVQDFLVHCPGDGALICLFGSIPFDAISQVISQI